MKRVFILFIIMCFVTGCTGDKDNTERLRVCTSFYAMYDLASQIGGDRVSIKNLVPNGAEPHDWEPSVKAMMSLESADIFIYNGLGMESFVEKIKASVANELVYVEASEGCHVLYGYEEEEENHSQEHGEEDNNSHVSDADPHVWLDPVNAVIEAENICDAFCESDPENEEYYRKNLESFKTKAQELDLAYKNGLANLRKREIVVSHGAYGYICRAYDLEQRAVEGMGGNSDPSPRRVKEIYDFIRDNDLKCIFYESLTGSRVAGAISEDLGTEMYPVTAYEGLSPDMEKAGYDYFDVMYMNLKSFEKGLR